MLNNRACLWTAKDVTFVSVGSTNQMPYLFFFCAFMCISLGCGMVSGKCDCLSLYTGLQRLVTVGVAVIFVKYYKCWCWTAEQCCAKCIHSSQGVPDSLHFSIIFCVKAFSKHPFLLYIVLHRNWPLSLAVTLLNR